MEINFWVLEKNMKMDEDVSFQNIDQDNTKVDNSLVSLRKSLNGTVTPLRIKDLFPVR